MSEENKETKDVKECSIAMVRKYPHAVVIVLVILAFLLGTFVGGGAGHRGGDYKGRMDRGGMQRDAYQSGRGGYGQDDRGNSMPGGPQETLPGTEAQVAPVTPTMPTPETPVAPTGTGAN